MTLPDFSSLAAQFRDIDMRTPGQWPRAPRITAGSIVLCIVLLLGWYFYWSDQMRGLTEVEAQKISLKKEYAEKMKLAISSHFLTKQKHQIETHVLNLERQLPNEEEMDALLTEINLAGMRRQLRFELFRPGPATVREYYAELPIEIKISGTYANLATFMADLADIPRIVTMTDIHLQGDDKNAALTLDANARTYRYLTAREIAAKQTAAQPSIKSTPGRPS